MFIRRGCKFLPCFYSIKTSPQSDFRQSASAEFVQLGRQKYGKLHRQTSEKSGIVNIVPYIRRDRTKEHQFQQTSPAHHTEKSKWDGVHRPVFLVLFSAHLLYTVCQLSGEPNKASAVSLSESHIVLSLSS